MKIVCHELLGILLVAIVPFAATAQSLPPSGPPVDQGPVQETPRPFQLPMGSDSGAPALMPIGQPDPKQPVIAVDAEGRFVPITVKQAPPQTASTEQRLEQPPLVTGAPPASAPAQPPLGPIR
jgi:hypothetical protein